MAGILPQNLQQVRSHVHQEEHAVFSLRQDLLEESLHDGTLHNVSAVALVPSNAVVACLVERRQRIAEIAERAQIPLHVFVLPVHHAAASILHIGQVLLKLHGALQSLYMSIRSAPRTINTRQQH
ncbi:unnamed protein product [Phytophthora lilii]|uniref:Unnamed protein product n=1 Tax=Phytophthora lilii TaxID=2077276 RepID=A0A9W6WJK6_9STRA|nr:unnamed protein product [Phytophthora lilii]